jgi:DNA processing protein
VVSELAPGRSPTRIRFLTRNRLIAALTRGTVVVEAAVRSGALNTAGWAARLHRPLMAVPGPVTAAQSEGVHQLVRRGAAGLVTRGQEVLEMVGESGEHLDQPRRGQTRRRDQLPERDKQVLEAVPLHRGASVDSVARTAGIGLFEVQSLLHRFQREGLVERADGGWRISDTKASDSAAESSEIPTMGP